MASLRARLSMQEIQSFRKFSSVHHFSLTLTLMHTVLSCGEQIPNSPKCLSLAKSWEQEMTSILSLPPSVTPSKQLVFTVQAKNSGPMCVVMSVLHIFNKSTGTHGGISGRNPDARASQGLNWSILVSFSVWLFYGSGLVVTWGVTAVKQKGVGQGIVWKQEGWMDNNRQIE